jgi:hypothetical protein
MIVCIFIANAPAEYSGCAYDLNTPVYWECVEAS